MSSMSRSIVAVKLKFSYICIFYWFQCLDLRISPIKISSIKSDMNSKDLYFVHISKETEKIKAQTVLWSHRNRTDRKMCITVLFYNLFLFPSGVFSIKLVIGGAMDSFSKLQVFYFWQPVDDHSLSVHRRSPIMFLIYCLANRVDDSDDLVIDRRLTR